MNCANMPLSASGSILRAQYASARGDIPEAISAYQSLLGAYPDDPAGLNNMAIMYTASGDNVKAASYFKTGYGQRKMGCGGGRQSCRYRCFTLDNPTDAKKYIDLSAAVSNGTDTPLLGNQAIYAFETGDSSWKRSALADEQPSGWISAGRGPQRYELHAGVACGGQSCQPSTERGMLLK